MPSKILIVDDEPAIVDLVAAYLRREGHEVAAAVDGPAGVQAARTFRPDVIVLDVMLPGLDGLEVLARLRRESGAYVILLTARSDEADKVLGLSMGADDYMTKPFSPRELVARVKAGLRRLQPGALPAGPVVLSFRRLRIDPGRRQTWVDERPVELTAVEFDLLWALAEHNGRVLSREQLLERVWGYDFYGDERVVDVHIGHIRHKLGESGLIATVRGVGYRLAVDEEP